MMKNLKFSIITVSYNSVNTIEETILSVLNQNYKNFEYIIIDGGSTDGTVDIIKKYSDRLAYWVSEPDKGMYDALAKGFERVTGDICAYINADDYYQKYTFEVLNEVFQNDKINWVTGINTIYNDKSQIVSVKIPYKYRRKFIQKGLYNDYNLPPIQQESTFWRSELLQTVNFKQFKSYKYAGDDYLWSCFAKKYELDIVMSVLSGFRKHSGQLSENANAYKDEIKLIVSKKAYFWDYALAFFDRIRSGFSVRLNKKIIKYNHKNKCWE